MLIDQMRLDNEKIDPNFSLLSKENNKLEPKVIQEQLDQKIQYISIGILLDLIETIKIEKIKKLMIKNLLDQYLY